MLRTILASACAVAFSANLQAVELEKKHINYLGPIAENNALKPYETAQQKEILANFAATLSSNSKKVTVFGQSLTWQPFDQVSELTVAGLQALKFNVSVDRFTQGTLTFNGVDNASLFINGKSHALNKDKLDVSLATGQHQFVLLAEQVADWKKVNIDFAGKADHDNIQLIEEITTLSAQQLFDAATITGLSLSPDSKDMIITTSHYSDKGGDKAIRTTQLRDDKYQVRYSWDNAKASGFAWSPDNQKLIYTIDNAWLILCLFLRFYTMKK